MGTSATLNVQVPTFSPAPCSRCKPGKRRLQAAGRAGAHVPTQVTSPCQKAFPSDRSTCRRRCSSVFGSSWNAAASGSPQQRRLIVEQVFSHHDHFDADELLDHLHPLMAQRHLSRPTVYRTLSELVEAGMLRKMVLRGPRAFTSTSTATPATTISIASSATGLSSSTVPSWIGFAMRSPGGFVSRPPATGCSSWGFVRIAGSNYWRGRMGG